MRFTYCITKATNTRSESVTRIGFPLQQWLHKSPWMLRLYIYCLSCLYSRTTATS